MNGQFKYGLVHQNQPLVAICQEIKDAQQQQQVQQLKLAQALCNKRHRTTFDQAQLNLLEEAFKQNSYPSPASRECLAAQTNLDSSRVQVWFQNRRAKHKKQMSQAMRCIVASTTFQQHHQQQHSQRNPLVRASSHVSPALTVDVTAAAAANQQLLQQQHEQSVVTQCATQLQQQMALDLHLSNMHQQQIRNDALALAASTHQHQHHQHQQAQQHQHQQQQQPTASNHLHGAGACVGLETNLQPLPPVDACDHRERLMSASEDQFASLNQTFEAAAAAVANCVSQPRQQEQNFMYSQHWPFTRANSLMAAQGGLGPTATTQTITTSTAADHQHHQHQQQQQQQQYACHWHLDDNRPGPSEKRICRRPEKLEGPSRGSMGA